MVNALLLLFHLPPFPCFPLFPFPCFPLFPPFPFSPFPLFPPPETFFSPTPKHSLQMKHFLKITTCQIIKIIKKTLFFTFLILLFRSSIAVFGKIGRYPLQYTLSMRFDEKTFVNDFDTFVKILKISIKCVIFL